MSLDTEPLYIVMPAYNEQENIETVVRSWYPILKGKADTSRLIVADSGSTDNTHAILLRLQAEMPKLEILSDTGKQHGPKLIAMYHYAIDCGAVWIFQTDSDGQTSPEEFSAFWDMRNDLDAILGHRSVRGDGKQRAFVERVVCILLRIYFGVDVPDANAPFRLMRTDTVAKYIDRFDYDFNLPNVMLTAFFAYYKDRVAFKVISFKNRQAGTNSVNISKIIKIGWRALADFGKFRKGMAIR